MRTKQNPLRECDTRVVISKDASFEELAAMSHYQQYHRRGTRLETFVTIKTTKTSVYIGVYEKMFMFVFGRAFPKTICLGKVSWKKGQYCSISDNRLDCIIDVLHYIGLEWLQTELSKVHVSLRHYIFTKSIMQSIFLGNITCAKDLYNALLIRVYKVKNFSWRLLQSLYQTDTFPRIAIQLHQIMHYTSCPSVTVGKLMASSRGSEYSTLFFDTLRLATEFGYMINSNWSLKRLNEEHLNWSKEVDFARYDIKDIKAPLYKDVPTFIGYDAKVLNTAEELFLEGKTMHNCVFSNYFDRVRDHKYIIIKLFSPNTLKDINIGIRFNMMYSKAIELDQAFYAYNESLTNEDRTYVHEFYEKYANQFSCMIQTELPDYDIQIMAPQEPIHLPW